MVLSSRVIGRGRCIKCGREGSVVLKEISGRIYVYIKHGREWCYLGPLEKVDLSSIVIGVRDYHTFTTKLAEYFRVRIGGAGVKVSTPFIVGLALLLAAYGIGLGGYGNYVLTMVLLSTLSFLFSIAVYENTYAGHQEYGTLSRNLSRGLKLYILLTIALTIIAVITTIPLVSPLSFKFTCIIPLHTGHQDIGISIEEPGILSGSRISVSPAHTATGIETYAFINIMIPISSIIIASLLITYLSRPLSNSLKRLATYIVISVLASYILFFAIFFTIPSIGYVVVGGAHALVSLIASIIVSATIASTTTIVFIVVFIVLVSILKGIIRM